MLDTYKSYEYNLNGYKAMIIQHLGILWFIVKFFKIHNSIVIILSITCIIICIIHYILMYYLIICK